MEKELAEYKEVLDNLSNASATLAVEQYKQELIEYLEGFK